MNDTTRLETVFLENLAVIERIIAALARRHGFGADDAIDFASWIKLRLVEDGYAAFRKFRGESRIATYLTVVIAMLARDYRAQLWGRWRPSVAARRQGDLAVRLETLVHRDGMRFSHAAEALRTAGRTSLSNRQLGQLLGALPTREPLRPLEAGSDALTGIEAQQQADELVMVAAAREDRQRADAALEQALASLDPGDRVVMRMHFWEGLSVADIGRALAIEQKPLYRRIERILGALRNSLHGAGVRSENVAELVEHRDYE
jgi:RNA polymerase sigma factor for flagellar operon FliA